MVDILLGSSWRFDGMHSAARSGGGRAMTGEHLDNPDRFVWRSGRSEVVVARDGEAFTVLYSTIGRLFGPRQVLYEQIHRVPKLAAWDVMARVIRASEDEEEGIRVARDAARWMRDASAR